MSLILEAINRSAQERRAEQGSGIPGLDSPAYVDEPGQRVARRIYLPWLALCAALLLIGLLVVERMSADKAASNITTKERPELAPQVRPEQPPTELDDTPADRPPPASTSPAAVHRDAAVAALYSNRGANDGRAPAPAAAVPQSAEEPRNARAGVARTEQPIDVGELMARTEDALKSAGLQPHPAPFIADLSQQKKDAIPSILYRQHDYSSDAAQSYVVLNGKPVREGDSVAGGVKLDEILPDSIILSQRGEQFRLRALNSWVNL